MNNRREFLKHLAVAGTVAAVADARLFGQEPPKPDDAKLFAVYHREQLFRKKRPRTITIPDVGEYKVLKGDFHIHTLFSDGLVMPNQRVDEAVDNGLDVIALTDHIEYRPYLTNGVLELAANNDDHNTSYNLAKPTAEQKGVILVPGVEITKHQFPPGHFNPLFIKDANPIAAASADWKQMLAVAADQGAFNLWNHPNAASAENDGKTPMQFFDTHEEARRKGHLHGIEVFGYGEYFTIAHDWAGERNLAPFANSDIHESEWDMYGYQSPLRPITLVFAKERTFESVREAFFAGRTVGWAMNMILGCEPWVENLFRACVEIKKSDAGLSLHNRSDIPCIIEASGKTAELSPQATVKIGLAQALTITNWFVGMGKPLKIVP